MYRRLKYICLEMVRAGKTESVYDVKRAEDIIHNIQISMSVLYGRYLMDRIDFGA